MESIARCLSLPLPIRRCRKCKEYKTTMANLLQIIQKQNEQLQNLQRQLHFTRAQYLEQNQRLSRTQEKFLCNACLVKFKQPNHDFELCSTCSTRVPDWIKSSWNFCCIFKLHSRVWRHQDITHVPNVSKAWQRDCIKSNKVIFIVNTVCYFLDFRSRSHFRGPGDKSRDLVTSKTILWVAFMTSYRTVHHNDQCYFIRMRCWNLSQRSTTRVSVPHSLQI